MTDKTKKKKRRTKTTSIKTSKTAKITSADKLTSALKKTEAGQDESAITFWCPTGVPSLDLAINAQGRGWPGGRIVLIRSGKESEGKSTLVGHTIAEMQKMGGVTKIFDTERTFDKGFSKRLGVDHDALIKGNIDTLEDLLSDLDDTIRIAMKHPEVPVLLVWDTVASTLARVEAEGDYGDSHVGVHARAMSAALRKIVSIMGQHGKILLLVTNQTRYKIGGNTNFFTGPEETSLGGVAINFQASVIVRLSRIGKLEKTRRTKKKEIGVALKAKVVKNKVGWPNRIAKFDLYYKDGIAGRESLFYSADGVGLLQKVGKQYEGFDDVFTKREFERQLVNDDTFFEMVKDALVADMCDMEGDVL